MRVWWFSGHVVYALSKLRRTRSTRSSHRHQPHQLRCPVRRSGNLEQKWSQFVSHVSPKFYLIPRYPKGRTARSGETKWMLLAAILLWHSKTTSGFGISCLKMVQYPKSSGSSYPIALLWASLFSGPKITFLVRYIPLSLYKTTISFLNLTVSAYFNQDDL